MIGKLRIQRCKDEELIAKYHLFIDLVATQRLLSYITILGM